MKIRKVGEKDAIDIPAKDVIEFKEHWIEQGGKVLKDVDDTELVVMNKDGKILHLFVLGDTIFPFDFEE